MPNNEYMARFFKTDNGTLHWETLADHLTDVSSLTADLAEQTGSSHQDFLQHARLAGLLHDIGKFTDAFQLRLKMASEGKKAPNAPHSHFGAIHALLNNMTTVGFAVAGHHAGLPDKGAIVEKTKMNRDIVQEALNQFPVSKEISSSMQSLMQKRETIKRGDLLQTEVYIRMLASCLIDADRLVSARFEYGEEFGSGVQLNAAMLHDKLMGHLQKLMDAAPDTRVNRIRQDILNQCLAAAETDRSLLSLNVPTGGGKTLASMALALRRAMLRPENIRRIIVVIPYLSIIEQNAQVYKQIFGEENVLEHHSNVEAEKDKNEGGADESGTSRNAGSTAPLALLRENWDAPIIITTSVRFFESLFSHHPRDIRRIHNVARSLVIFDEVQTMQPKYLSPLLDMMKTLAEHWRTTFLLCTATQPAFETSRDNPADKRWDTGTLDHVIAPSIAREHFEALARVQEPAWPAQDTRTDWVSLAAELLSASRVLCIVNTKAQARELFQTVHMQAGNHEGIYHLSTNMCPQHRLDVINSIRARMNSGSAERRTIVISTQLVEAGVDLDFPVVYRAFAPLDSIVQAAGRCNREGRIEGRGGKLIIFRPEVAEGQQDTAPYFYSAGTMRYLVERGLTSIHDPQHMQNFFDHLYSGMDQDGKNIQGLRKQLAFRQTSKAFEIIENSGVGVVVPYNDTARRLMARLSATDIPDRKVLRGLQRYMVNIRETVRDTLLKQDVLSPADVIPTVMFLDEACYTERYGLTVEL